MRSSAFLLLLTIASNALGQFAYMGFGYAKVSPSSKGLNRVLTDYNEARPWLSKEFRSFRNVRGFSFSMGGGAGPIWVDITFNSAKRILTAEGVSPINNGINGTREVLVKNPTGSLNIGLGAAMGSNGGLAFGLQTDIGQVDVKTRYHLDDYETPDWTDVQSNIMARTGPVLFLMIVPGPGIFFGGRIGYGFSVFKTNYTALDEAINKHSYDEDQAKFSASNHAFHFQLLAGFGIAE